MKRLLALLTPVLLSAIPYEINFVGFKDQNALKAMFDASDLVTLQDRPPASINGLRYRISGDIPQLLNVLKAYGYYDATITSDVQIQNNKVQVYLLIHSGPQYRISSYEVFHGDCTEPALIAHCKPFIPEALGLKIGQPALSVDIVNAELTLLNELSRCGYPLASIEKRRVIVDMQEKNVEAAACINEGPLSKFGPMSVMGLKSVKPEFIDDRVAWQEGQLYNPDFVEETQKRLLNSGLFSSVMITHDNELDPLGEIPMKVRISEAKHKQVSIGAFYATVDGPGANFSWTHRNVRGLGETVSLLGEFSKRYYAGSITYKKPDFWVMDQTYRAVGALERENINPYIAFTYRLANYLDRKFNSKLNGSIGLSLEHITVSQSASDGTYFLLTMPMSIRYNATDDLMDPTIGYTIVYQPHLFQSLEHGDQHFMKQRITGTFYIPVGTKRVVFAGRIQFGSIAGAPQQDVPLPVLFLGGSEDDLRGYRYKTVSPLNEHREPFGGRGAVFLTAETRFRMTEKIGVVPFADFGTVTFTQYPTFDAEWFKSVGIGLRYYTFFGPLRGDIGFPLDRRKGIDPAFRVYASIGQTF